MNATTLNLASLLDSQARVTPERTALVCGAVRLTYAELHARVCQLAVGLRLRGLGPGDHIALSCPNTPHFVMAYFAILKLGGVVVPLNVLLKPREIEYHLRDSDAKALLVFEGAPGLPMAAMAREACDRMEAPPPIVVMTIAPGAPGPIHGAATLGELMHGQPATCVSHPTAPDDTAVMLYTSGTTGQAKGAELTHLNMTLNAIAGRDLVMPALDNGVAAKNVTLITLPLFHSFGQTALLNAAISGGFTAVLMPRMDPATVFQAFAEEQVLWWAGVPTMFWALLQYARAAGPAAIEAARSLRVCMSGGAPLPVQLLKDFQETFGVQVLEGYGLSETSPIASFNQMHRPSKPGTVGLPISGCEIAVVNDRDDALPAGRAGEVVIRGHNIMKGYYKRPAETREALRGGWFHTGEDRKSTRLNSSHVSESRMPSSA